MRRAREIQREKWWFRLELFLLNYCICMITCGYSYESILINIRIIIWRLKIIDDWIKNILIKLYKNRRAYKHADWIFICMLRTYHTNSKMCIMHRKILCQVLYNTPDLISTILFICRRCILYNYCVARTVWFDFVVVNIHLPPSWWEKVLPSAGRITVIVLV